jgi:hypothetical protein
MKTIPECLPDAHAVQTLGPLKYPWDDATVGPLKIDADDPLKLQLRQLSERATLAFMIGCAEWLVYRFEPLNDPDATATARQFLQAAWALTIHAKYANYGNTTISGVPRTGWVEQAEADHAQDEPLWIGPVRGPINQAMYAVESALQELEAHGFENPENLADYVAECATEVHHLVVMVTEHHALFDAWVAWVLQQLQARYPRNPADPRGDAVPREALDPMASFDPAQSETLVLQFLGGLDWRENRFLSSPQAMLVHITDDEEPNFPWSRPYEEFSLAVDRQVRQARQAARR